MDIIYEKIVSAQSGNEPAMLELIEQFSPLLKKYAHLLQTEDSLDELTVDFIELIMAVKLTSLRSHNDGALVNYIKKTMRYKYISRSKRRQQEAEILHWDDFEEAVQRKHEPRCPLFTSEAEFLQGIPAKILSSSELSIIAMIYLEGYSAAEIARAKGITRQAVNQIKRRALKKLHKAICKSQQTDNKQDL